MFFYKLNVFHWHLTDDEGWRLEIQSLPNLTLQGAFRGRGHVIEPQYGGNPRRPAILQEIKREYTEYQVNSLTQSEKNIFCQFCPICHNTYSYFSPKVVDVQELINLYS